MIKVIEDWILMEPLQDEEKKYDSGIIIPTTMQKAEVVKRARVIQISEDVEKDLHYKTGDIILYHSKTGIPIENGKYMFLKCDGMLAIEVPDVK